MTRSSVTLVSALKLVLVLVLVLGLSGCGSSAPRGPSSGRDVFASSCSSCHSLMGNESSHKQGGDLLGFRMTRADVFSFTRVMPTAAGLSAAQLRAVTDYVFAAQQSAARATRSAR